MDRMKSLSPKMATLLAHLLKGDVAKVLDPKGALETNGSLFTGFDTKVYHLRDALKTNGNPFTIVDVTDLVTREAFINNGSFFFTDVDVTVYYPPGMPSINIGTQSWLMSLRYRALAMDICTH